MEKTEKKKTFSEIIVSDKPVLVDFFAEWCGPCKIMKPVLEELKTKMGDAITILKVDVDKSPEVSNVYNIQGVPTLILFKNGEIIWRQAGVISALQLENIISKRT
ncbi:MAG: thioredoxin [Bacteroidetes bacterium]|nr:thioredoxin [Bacteroidota bacterium]MBS1932234.1 thioredoxin [Bacteroidota bacterium]